MAIPAFLTRTGVFPYSQVDGTVRRELRLPGEVFRPDSLASLRYATVTDLHPEAPVDSASWRTHAIGTVGSDVKQEGVFVASEIIIHDKAAIDRIDKGERNELSCGYSCDLESNAGVYEGQSYDAIQRNIRYNHVAIGPNGWGRAGCDVKLRLDSGDAFACIPDHTTKPEKQRNMKRRFTVDGVDFEIDAEEAFFQMLGKVFARDKMTIDSLTAERDKERARADAADALVKANATRFDGAVTAKLDLLAKSKTLLPADYSYAAKSDRDIMTDAVRVTDSTFDATGKSEDYLRARFDAACDAKAKSLSADTKQKIDSKGQPEVNPFVEAQRKFHDDTINAWKQPLAVGHS